MSPALRISSVLAILTLLPTVLLSQAAPSTQPADASNAGVVRLTLADALERAKANSPQFQSAVTDVGLARENRIQARADSLRLATLRYQSGEATALEVVDAQNTLATARNNFDDGQVRYRGTGESSNTNGAFLMERNSSRRTLALLSTMAMSGNPGFYSGTCARTGDNYPRAVLP